MRILATMFGVVGFFTAIWAFVDAARVPERYWEATGRTKPHWLGLIFMTLLLGVWFVGVGIYLLRARPEIKRLQRRQTEVRTQTARDLDGRRRGAPEAPDLAEAARRMRRERDGGDAQRP